MNKNQALEITTGIVKSRFDGSKSENGKWRPAKLVIDTESGMEAHVLFWPRQNWVDGQPAGVKEPVQFGSPLLFDSIPEDIVGKKVIVSGARELKDSPNGTIEQFTRVVAVKVDSPVQVTPPNAHSAASVSLADLDEGSAKDRLIVDQVLTKIAADIFVASEEPVRQNFLSSLSAQESALIAIELWQSIRNRHIKPVQEEVEEDDDLEVLDVINLEEEE